MLTARGGTRWQLVRLTAAEAVPLALVAAAAGGALGVALARLLAGTELSGAGVGPDAWLAAAAVAVGAMVIMVLPVLSTVTPGAVRARQGRQGAVSGITRAGGDLALILLAIVAGWQLRHYSAVSAGGNGSFGIDPVIVVAPALALAGGTVLALRLLPLGGKAGDRLAARGRRLTTALASWQISRQPIRQGGAALLIVLAVATATLALAQRQSWTRSDHDQAAFAAGADVRAQTSQPLSLAQADAITQLPGVRHATPVATFAQPSGNSEVVALNSRLATNVTLLRADQSPLPAATLFGKITPAGPAGGVTLPGRPAGVELTARLGPAALGPALAPVEVTLEIRDADGDVYQVSAGTLAADGRDHTLTAALASGAGIRGRGIYPLRLVTVNLAYTLPAKKPRTSAQFTVQSISAGPGTASLSGAALSGWNAVASSPELTGAQQTLGTQGPSGTPGVVVAGASVTFDPGFGLAASGIAGVPPTTVFGSLQLTAATAAATVIPGLATQGFLAANNAGIGSTVHVDVNGAIVSVRIVAAMTTFPTVPISGGGLIVDLGRLQDVLAGSQLAPAQATQWWLATSGPAPPGLAAVLPSGSVITSANGAAAGLLGNPLSTVPQQALLAVALAAAVLAVTGFCVSIAAGVRQRRAESALLAALGVPPRAAAGQLCLEKLMLSLPSALAGLILGVVLAELLVPAITLSAAATAPVPPVLIQFGWAQVLPLALAIAVLPVLAAGLTIARRPDAAAELRAAEAA
jgi:hypothetical protein